MFTSFKLLFPSKGSSIHLLEMGETDDATGKLDRRFLFRSSSDGEVSYCTVNQPIMSEKAYSAPHSSGCVSERDERDEMRRRENGDDRENSQATPETRTTPHKIWRSRTIREGDTTFTEPTEDGGCLGVGKRLGDITAVVREAELQAPVVVRLETRAGEADSEEAEQEQLEGVVVELR